MRLRAVAAGLLLLALSAVVLTTGAGRGAAPAAPTPTPAPPQTVTAAAPPRSPAMPERNVFEYEREQAPFPALLEPLRPAPSQVPRTPDVSPKPAEPAVRLVGFLRRAGGLEAALAIRGSVFVLAVGERAEGYLLLSADEDTGVRIEGPDGAAFTLAPS